MSNDSILGVCDNSAMLFLTLIYSYLKDIGRWALHNGWIAVTIALSILVIFLFLWGRKPRVDVEIRNPAGQVANLQENRDVRVESIYNGIDATREADDNRIRQAQNRPVRNGNVTAEELEDILK